MLEELPPIITRLREISPFGRNKEEPKYRDFVETLESSASPADSRGGPAFRPTLRCYTLF